MPAATWSYNPLLRLLVYFLSDFTGNHIHVYPYQQNFLLESQTVVLQSEWCLGEERWKQRC